MNLVFCSDQMRRALVTGLATKLYLYRTTKGFYWVVAFEVGRGYKTDIATFNLGIDMDRALDIMDYILRMSKGLDARN